MDKGILLCGRDEVIESRARRYGVSVEFGDCFARLAMTLPFEKTLITVPGTRVPWELLGAAWKLLDRWDAAVPLWQYTVTAEGVGEPADRERTRAVVRDLRVLLHATELLFVRAGGPGQELVERWAVEGDGDPRLAFLRALSLVKPRLYVLPVSWLAASRPPAVVDGRRGREDGGGKTGEGVTVSSRLVRVEISPGQFVKCRAGDEARVLDLLRRGRG